MMRVVNGEGERSQNNKLQFPYRFAQYSIDVQYKYKWGTLSSKERNN